MSVIEFNGKIYASIMDLYKAECPCELSYSTFRGRILAGWPLDKVFTTPLKTKYKYKVDGKVYESLKELAEAAGISYMAAVKRAHRGFTSHEIFYGKSKNPKIQEEICEKKKRGNSVVAGGKFYDNIVSAHAETNSIVSLNTVRQRLRRGFSVDEALGLVHREDQRSARHSDCSLVINGQNIKLKDAANKYGVPISTIRDRIARGAAAEQAVGLMPVGKCELITQRMAYGSRVKKKKTLFVVNGKEFDSIKKLAEEFCLPYYLVYNRIKVYGWPVDRAVSEPANETVEVNGEKFKSALNAWEKIGETSLYVFSARRSAGYELAVCLGIEPLPAKIRYELNGKFYSTLDDIAREFNITAQQISVRLKTMSLEDAVYYKPVVGRYTKAKLESDTELANRAAILYFVRINTGEGVLQKVGITTRSVRARFGLAGVDLIREWRGTLFEMFNLEQKVMNYFSENHYRAEQEFDGRTETFIFLPSEELDVIDFINKEMGCVDI